MKKGIIKCIYISGDGAEWIKFGAEYIPDAIYVLDLYHLQKYVTMAFKDEKKLKRALWKAIYKGDLEKIKEIFNDRYTSCEREGEKEVVKRALEYIEKQLGRDIKLQPIPRRYSGMQRRESCKPYIIGEALKRAHIVEQRGGP